MRRSLPARGGRAGRDRSREISMTQARVGELLARAETTLRKAGVADARREAVRLLAHALGVERLGLLALGRDATVEADGFERLLERRVRREPLAFIVGRQGFWTLELAVSPDTLIPRADSETLVEALLEARPDRRSVTRLLDLGTGTGCLLLAALSEYPDAWGVGVDRSTSACQLALSNARTNGLATRSAFACGDWTTPIRGSFDVILGNPPYIPTADVPGLMPEVAVHEPAGALDGGVDGLDAYRILLPAVTSLLAPGGLCVLEVGAGQAEEVAGLGMAVGLRPAGTRADLGGITRAVLLDAGSGTAQKTFGTNAVRS